MYRKSIMAVLYKNGKVLIGQRANNHAIWQFPQGGIASGESIEDAVFRELKEELGYTGGGHCFIAPVSTKYLWPLNATLNKEKSQYDGQEHSWCLIEPENSECIDIDASDEFISYKWIDYWKALEIAPSFKLRSYIYGLLAIKRNYLNDKYPSNIISNIKNIDSNIANNICRIAVCKNTSLPDSLEAISYTKNIASNDLERLAWFNSNIEDLNLYYIGNIQSNKLKSIYASCNWVLSLYKLKHAQLLNLLALNKPINVCIQVNISREAQKGGLMIEGLFNFFNHLSIMKGLVVRGLMCIRKAGEISSEDMDALYRVYTDLQKRFPGIDTLSMGMTDDYMDAIKSGSNMIRVGRSIFSKIID